MCDTAHALITGAADSALYGGLIMLVQVVRVMACFAAGLHKVEVAVLMYSLTLDHKSWWQVWLRR